MLIHGFISSKKSVSIQPKPKKGLEVLLNNFFYLPPFFSFNPAEAEEGFRRKSWQKLLLIQKEVSIQPKPKKGLEAKKW